jgi:hypothetical protein
MQSSVQLLSKHLGAAGQEDLSDPRVVSGQKLTNPAQQRRRPWLREPIEERLVQILTGKDSERRARRVV